MLGAWKIIGMTMTCNRCDILCDVKLKWNRRVTEKGEEMRGPKRTDRQTDRERDELWNTNSCEKDI